LSVLSKEKREISHQISAIRKQEQRDGNTEFTEVRSQRTQGGRRAGKTGEVEASDRKSPPFPPEAGEGLIA
jgi:hypothetical protein